MRVPESACAYGAPHRVVNNVPSWPGGNSATWRDSDSATTWGSGTVLVERLVFGALRTLAPGFVSQIEADLLRGQYIDPFDLTTVLDYAQKWASARIHRPNDSPASAEHDRHPHRGHGSGSRRLAAVTPSEVQAWASDRARVLAPRRCATW
jgi:hypothetical protein